MAGIEIKSLTKDYRGARALDGIDLTVAEGELLALVGPSGSGKSTLLRLIAGLEQPTAGGVSIGGRDLAGVPPHQRNVSLVFQSLALYSHLRVGENLTFGLQGSAERGARSAERVAETAELLEISHLLERYPAELSGGEQQRVALGRAIVRRPAALLFDEPLSSVDGPLRRSLRRVIHDVQRRLGVPTIYVTHDSGEAMALGDRVAVIARGRLEQVGTPAEVYDRPASRFVADFLGPQGMNFVPGEADFVVTGFRPEDAEVAGDGPAQGTVLALESFGAATYAQVSLSATISLSATSGGLSSPVTIQLERNQRLPKIGEEVRFRVPDDQRHPFDARTGLRLRSAS